MRRNPKHIDINSPMAIRQQKMQDRKHTAVLLLEVTLMMVISAVIAYATSQMMMQSYAGIVSTADRLEEQRSDEEMSDRSTPAQTDQTDQGDRSPLYIDHLSGQDYSWVAPKEEEGTSSETNPEPKSESKASDGKD